MNVTILPSAPGAPSDRTGQFLTSYLIDGEVAIDAGCVGLMPDIAAQARVRHIVLTHGHLDHIASLPILLDNVYKMAEPPVLHASRETLTALREGLLDGTHWPDLDWLASAEPPFVRIEPFETGRAFRAGELRITPVPVDHTIPSWGFLVESRGAGAVFSSDTGPTEALWERANGCSGLGAVFLEASFPDALAEIARASCHHTTGTFAEELKKLRRASPVYAVHLKPRFVAEVAEELEALRLPNVRIGWPGTVVTI